MATPEPAILEVDRSRPCADASAARAGRCRIAEVRGNRRPQGAPRQLFAGRVAPSADGCVGGRRPRIRSQDGKELSGAAPTKSARPRPAGPACPRSTRLRRAAQPSALRATRPPEGLAWIMSVTGLAANCCPPGYPQGLPPAGSLLRAPLRDGSGYGRVCHAQQFSVGTAWEQKGCRSEATGVKIGRTGDGWQRLEGRMSVGCVGFLNRASQVRILPGAQTWQCFLFSWNGCGRPESSQGSGCAAFGAGMGLHVTRRGTAAAGSFVTSATDQRLLRCRGGFCRPRIEGTGDTSDIPAVVVEGGSSLRARLR